jgi:hypothetical protein
MKIYSKLVQILALVPLLLFDSAKALEEPTSLAAGMTSSVKNHRDLAKTNDDSLPFEQWLQELDQVQDLEYDEYGAKDKVREIILLAQETTLDDEPIINYKSVDLKDIKRFQKKIKTLLHKAESQSMAVLEEDEKVDLTAAYSSARDILEATEAVLEEMRQVGGDDVLKRILLISVIITVLSAFVLANLLLALPVAILALLNRLISQARYCAFQLQLCPEQDCEYICLSGLFLMPLCAVWKRIDKNVCEGYYHLESEYYNEFLRDTIPLLINAVHAPETVP